MRETLPLLGGRSRSKALAVNAQRTVNWDPRPEPVGAKSRLVLAPTPGLVRAENVGVGPCRSHFETFKGKVYWVSGTHLYSRDASGVLTNLGEVPGSGWCGLASGAVYLMVVNGVNGFYTTGTTLSTITDPLFPPNPTSVAYMDGYFIVNESGTGFFHLSSISTGVEDPTTWPGDAEEAEADPDDLTAVIVVGDKLYAVGPRTTQMYYDSGNPDFPFEPFSNGVMEWGAESPQSIAVADGYLFMLSRSKAGGIDVLMVTGTTPASIAEQDFVEELEGYVTDDAEGYCYMMASTVYYVLTLPTSLKTFVYNTKSKLWYEWISNGLDRHRSRGHGFLGRDHFVGDFETGKVYTLDPSVFTEDGDTILRSRTTSITHSRGKDIECNEIEIEFKKGTALITGTGSDPQVMMTYSVDGGDSWSSVLAASLGGIGDTERRVVYRRLGQGRSFVFEYSVFAPIELLCIATYGDFVEIAE